jgi:hypothetical protein
VPALPAAAHTVWPRGTAGEAGGPERLLGTSTGSGASSSSFGMARGGMLLSFERPGVRSGPRFATRRGTAAGDRLFADLENCTAHHAAAFPRGEHEPKQLGITDREASRLWVRVDRVEITVKIIRAHGGCLGT